jgi:phosphoribosylamine---glycine ligase
MNVAIIGSGGREHAICDKISKSQNIKQILCIPGNPGTSTLGLNLDIDFLNFNLLYKNLVKHKIDLVIIGPEVPLVKGIVDYLNRKRIKVFGPTKFAAQLEGSKVFMKKLCYQNKIPTAGYKICKSLKDVKKFFKLYSFPIVVKADGLAAGKGVEICKNKKQVERFAKLIFTGKFSNSKKLILEEFLKGEEVSYFVIVDKNNFSFIGSAQDHKRVGINETGPNTGGMGAYSPAPIINNELKKKIEKEIITPTLNALKKKKEYYTGFLYAGLMIKNNQPYLIEYNVRMGDPECQVILPRIKTDFLKIIDFAVNNKLNKLKITWKKEKCMTIVICANGYPRIYRKNILIKNLDKMIPNKNSKIYHAGTIIKNNKLFSNGGRVLNINYLGKNYKYIRKKIIQIIKKINFKNSFFRPDIGWRVIDK